MLSELPTTIPWFVLLLVFVGMAALQWRVISALDKLASLLVPQPSPPVDAASPAAPSKPAPKPAPPGPVIDQALVDAVKKFEGFNPKAYGDFKQYSIGYGTKATSLDEVITQPEAEKRLMTELAIAEQSVERFSPNAPRGVKQALTSLTYNAGPIWEQQTLGQLIQAGKYDEAKSHFIQYNHAGGQVNDDLTKRRQTEVAWFDNPL